jgi:phosphopantothenoylcysteine synthetase/decarboxylase
VERDEVGAQKGNEQQTNERFRSKNLPTLVAESVKIVGFKLEYRVLREELVGKAYEELMGVNASLVVANDLLEVKGESHRACLVGKGGVVEDFEGSKAELSKEIFDLLEEKL